jgi:hypothetical protein
VQDGPVETRPDTHEAPRTAAEGRSRLARLFVVVAGILIGQAILFGPSLVGHKILLPLDILGQRDHDLPASGLADRQPENYVLSDLVLHAEPMRVFAAQELRQGRFPLWNPFEYAGAPHVLMRFSPFMLLRTLTPSPWVLPWVQVVVALLAGLGTYVFCRRSLGLGFRASAITGCCYPLCAYFVFWLGYGHTWSLAWLPWLLAAEDAALRGKHKAAGILVGLLTGLVIVSGPLDTAAQELMVAGLFALWTWVSAFGRAWRSRLGLGAIALVALAWTSGLLLAAPEILSVSAYAKTGERMIRRSQGGLERPPIGLSALPLLALPNWNGSPEDRGVTIARPPHQNPMESMPMGYAGVLALLLLAPLAWQSPSHRRTAIFFTGLGVAGLGWTINLPGLTTLLRLPGLNMMSHNRLLFATALSILVLAAIGLDAIENGQVHWRRWHAVPALLALGLCVAAALRSHFIPTGLDAQIDTALRATEQAGWTHTVEDVERAKAAWSYRNAAGALWCGLCVAGWLLLLRRGTAPRMLVPVAGVLMAAELLWFGHGWNVQADPSLYYPRSPMLDQIATSDGDRVLGYDCLPAALGQSHGLREVRGYDAVDPLRLVSLLSKVAGPTSVQLPYAALQWYTPTLTLEPPASVRLPPILDMLDVRTVIFRGKPPADVTPTFAGDDAWALTNPRALPRAFVPRRIAYAPSAKERLAKLASADFDPREVAYVEDQVTAPAEMRGRVAIASEVPTHVTLDADMETPGLVVLSDLYDAGWRASRNSEPLPILRVNHAIRGMLVPAGPSRIELHYWPVGFTRGLRLAAVGLVILLAWTAGLALRRRAPTSR